jgi:enamine deaminase RidA (YjgF/YER057c/UK114 family)
MTGTVEGRLAALGITLPQPAAPIANYVGFNFAGPNLLVVSGQIPLVEGRITVTGKVGAAVSVEQATTAARTCLVNVVAQVKAALGDLDRVKRVVRLGGFIAAGPDFTQHAQVMNGASNLAVEIFGEAGRHARSTIGVPSLPGDAAVEVEGMFEFH